MNDINMHIEYIEKPTAKDVDFLTDKINKETLEYGEAHPFGFFIKDTQGKIIAGVNGYIIYGDIETDQLWVDECHRNKGMARKLMQKVHELGKEKGCKFSAIQTMSFQGAESFYKKLGYTEDFKRKGYAKESSCIFLRKSI